MPRPKIYKSDTERAKAHRKANCDVLTVAIRKDAQTNKETINNAAKASGLSTAAFILAAVEKYILDTLGASWIEGKKNNAEPNESEAGTLENTNKE